MYKLLIIISGQSGITTKIVEFATDNAVNEALASLQNSVSIVDPVKIKAVKLY